MKTSDKETNFHHTTGEGWHGGVWRWPWEHWERIQIRLGSGKVFWRCQWPVCLHVSICQSFHLSPHAPIHISICLIYLWPSVAYLISTYKPSASLSVEESVYYLLIYWSSICMSFCLLVDLSSHVSPRISTICLPICKSIHVTIKMLLTASNRWPF